MKELRAHADKEQDLDREDHACQRDVDRGQDAKQEVYAFVDKIINAMVATVKSGLCDAGG